MGLFCLFNHHTKYQVWSFRKWKVELSSINHMIWGIIHIHSTNKMQYSELGVHKEWAIMIAMLVSSTTSCDSLKIAVCNGNYAVFVCFSRGLCHIYWVKAIMYHPRSMQYESAQCITVNSLRFPCLHSCLGSPCPHRRQCSHTHRYHTDFGLGMMLKGGGNVPPSSK